MKILSPKINNYYNEEVKENEENEENIDYFPPEFSEKSLLYNPEYETYYDEKDEDEEEYDDEEEFLPVSLSDEMILRAHYLDLGMSHLLTKYREGSLSDQEYIQYYRMNGELRKILKNIWKISKRSLELWIRDHLYGGNKKFGITITTISELLDTLESLDMPAQPAVDIIGDAIGIDLNDDIKRYWIGAPLLYGAPEYEDESDYLYYKDSLRDAGVSSLDEYVVNDEQKWGFLKDFVNNFLDGYGNIDFVWNSSDSSNAYSFLYDDYDDNENYRGFSSYEHDYQNKNETPLEIFADIRLCPEYKGIINEHVAKQWNRINNLKDHMDLFEEVNINDQEWDELDTQTQMSLISRLLQMQHYSGNLIIDHIPDFRFKSEIYNPNNYYGSEKKELTRMLDDLHQSEMVNKWDKYFETHPHERWSKINKKMIKASILIDKSGAHDLSDKLDILIKENNNVV